MSKVSEVQQAEATKLYERIKEAHPEAYAVKYANGEDYAIVRIADSRIVSYNHDRKVKYYRGYLTSLTTAGLYAFQTLKKIIVEEDKTIEEMDKENAQPILDRRGGGRKEIDWDNLEV